MSRAFVDDAAQRVGIERAALLERAPAAPLARARLGREMWEGVAFQGGEAEIVSIEP